MHFRLDWSRITFARKIFFQVGSLLKFRKTRGQNRMDTLNVRTARWVTKAPWHVGNSGQLSTGTDRFVRGVSSCPFCEDRQGTIVSIDNSKLLPDVFPKFKERDLFNLNFRYRIKYIDNLLSLFPEIWKFREFSVPLFLTGFKNYTRVFWINLR